MKEQCYEVKKFEMTCYDDYPDHVLLALLRAEDREAFNTLYSRYWPPLWSYARNSTGNSIDAEDIVQELFLLLWDKRSNLEIATSLRAYLYKAVLNKVIDRANRSKHRATYLADLKRTFDEGSYATDEGIFEKELATRIEACMIKMPKKMRKIFSLSRLDGMTHQQISTSLNISRENVNRQIKNALILLKRSLLALIIILKYFLP